MSYLILDGTNDYASTPDHNDFDVTDNIDIRIAVAANDYTPASQQTLVSKYNFTSGSDHNISWELRLLANGHLLFNGTSDGEGSAGNSINRESDNGSAITTDGQIIAVRCLYQRIPSGECRFYTKATTEQTAFVDCDSDDGWTQLGSTISSSAQAIFSGSAPVRIGTIFFNGAPIIPFAGKVYAVVVIPSIAAGASRACKLNLAALNAGTTSHTDPTGKAWTLNNNGASIAGTAVIGATPTTAGSAANVASADTASISPQANAAILIDVVSRVASGTPNIPTASGNGITYVVEKTVTFASGLRRLTRLRGMHASPSAGTVTIDCGGQEQALLQWTVNQVGSVNTGGTNASTACRNSVSASGTGPSLEVTLPAIQNARNVVLSAHAFADDDAITPGSGFSELSDAASGDATSRLQTQYKVGRDRTAEATQTAVAVAAIATEIRTVGNAVTVDTLTSGQAAGSATFTSASVTPAADSLLLLSVYNSKASNADAPSTITAFGLTWTLLDSDAFGGSNSQRTSLYRAMGSAPTAGTVEIAFPASQLACEWSLVEYGNVPLGANGANAIEQLASAGGGTDNRTTLSVTLAAFSDADNAAYGVFGVDADNDVTPGTGFTQLHEVRNSSQTETLFTQTKTGEDTGVDASWTTSTPAIGYAAEIVHTDPADAPSARRKGLLLGVG